MYLDRAVTETIRTGGRLIISEPPRHGKSYFLSGYVPAWYLGTFPDARVMFGSYEADFAAQWGRRSRSLLEEHGHLFGVNVSPASSAANRWDIAGAEGGMQTAGVGGPFTGKGAHLLIVDDPVKGYEEAASETWREKTWEWWLQNAYTRLEPGGAAIVIGTRWHEDDLIGRILANQGGGESWREVRLPALAEDGDPLGRAAGEALWPERYPRHVLERIRGTIGDHRFSALYQQRPTAIEGGTFRREWFAGKIVPGLPNGAKAAIRAWDKAGTEGGGDWSAGVLLVEHGGLVYVADVVRGQWSSGRRDDLIDLTASLDDQQFGEHLKTWFEQEPGSGGKQSAEISKDRLSRAGYRVDAEPATGSKAVRAEPFATQCELGNVRIVKGDWNRAYIDQLCSFPNAAHDDMVDATSLAYVKLARPKKSFYVGVG